MKKILLIACLISLLTGCSAEINENAISKITNAVTETTEAIKATTETAKEVTAELKTEPTENEISLDKNSININEAADLLRWKLQNYGRNVEPNQHLIYEETEVYILPSNANSAYPADIKFVCLRHPPHHTPVCFRRLP